MASLLSLPDDLLFLLSDYLHNIEDFVSLCATCTTLRECIGSATPRSILQLAAAQSSTFFRPSPHFLVAATARELGHWARSSDANELELASTLGQGVEGLLNLSLAHCGLTMESIRRLHLMRFSIINPVTDLIDRCVGAQWYGTPNFWNGGVDDAYTIDADPPETLFHLAIYGELFGPDFDAFLDPDSQGRRLSVETRLEFIKYCVPDFATYDCQKNARDVLMASGDIDPRRAVKASGPYADQVDGSSAASSQHNVALVWLLQSSRWRPRWKETRARAGPDFQEDFQDTWWFDESGDQDWRQRMWEAIMVCQGLGGLGMIRPDLQDSWISKIRSWRERIASLEEEPAWIKVGTQATLEYPFLLGDLRICGSGYVRGT